MACFCPFIRAACASICVSVKCGIVCFDSSSHYHIFVFKITYDFSMNANIGDVLYIHPRLNLNLNII
jgi:hypothetical protein